MQMKYCFGDSYPTFLKISSVSVQEVGHISFIFWSVITKSLAHLSQSSKDLIESPCWCFKGKAFKMAATIFCSHVSSSVCVPFVCLSSMLGKPSLELVLSLSQDSVSSKLCSMPFSSRRKVKILLKVIIRVFNHHHHHHHHYNWRFVFVVAYAIFCLVKF